VGALAALVSVVATAQIQFLTAWRHHHHNVSINVMVAISSTILNGTAMYVMVEGTVTDQHDGLETNKH
jgi:hypothetical protein